MITMMGGQKVMKWIEGVKWKMDGESEMNNSDLLSQYVPVQDSAELEKERIDI